MQSSQRHDLQEKTRHFLQCPTYHPREMCLKNCKPSKCMPRQLNMQSTKSCYTKMTLGQSHVETHSSFLLILVVLDYVNCIIYFELNYTLFTFIMFTFMHSSTRCNGKNVSHSYVPSIFVMHTSSMTISLFACIVKNCS